MNRDERIEDNQFYHVYNRGNDRRRIFGDESDYGAFLMKMKSLAERYLVTVPVYALMPNHYHLIALQQVGGSLSRMMGALATSAAKRYNLKYGHIGHLFQGPYRYRPFGQNAFWDVACYIHLNPVRARLVEDPAQWRFSNFADCLQNPLKVTFHDDETELKVTFNYGHYVASVLQEERTRKQHERQIRLHVDGLLKR